MNDEAAVGPMETPANAEPYAGDLITVATYPDPATAQMARMALESAGVPVFLQGENANNLIPVAFLARLQVRPEDAALANDVLTASDLNPATLEEVTAAELADEGVTE